jgi:hypothetical protein
MIPYIIASVEKFISKKSCKNNSGKNRKISR